MGYKFEPKLSYKELGKGLVEIRFRWRQREKSAETKLVVDLDSFEQYRKFAETIDSERFNHLGNALNWDTKTNHTDRLVFLIHLLLYFPFSKTVKFQKEA